MRQNLVSILNNQNIDIPNIILREPMLDDHDRWVRHSIMSKEYVFSQPITFTPYASVNACSARCSFCSENLRGIKSAKHTSLLRPKDNYFSHLEKTLSELQNLPMSYSLSGLEMTDDSVWFIKLLNILSQHRALSPIESSVLYSNAAGLVENKNGIIDCIAKFSFDWIEISRHHFNERVNQKIMRFRSQETISNNQTFAGVIQKILDKTEIKLVCIVQNDGVDSPEAVYQYLAWAKSLGVKHVIFREFSLLNQSYKENSTFRYIEKSRKPMAELLKQLLNDANFNKNIDWLSSTNGYYFNNLKGSYNNIEVTFEHSDYGAMKLKHASNRIYKLVYHANGNLCADWDHDQNILLKCDNG